MSDSTAPSKAQWQQLCQAAVQFRNLAPWEWMTDDMLFAVQDPTGGPTSYCCVIGALGQEFGLVAYLGATGFACYRNLYSGGSPTEDERDFPYLQCCLMASFEPRRNIEPRDYEIIQRLGLRFRGSNAWPLFRSFLPGYLSWYLDAQQARYLTVILKQALEMARQAQGDPDLLRGHAEQIPARVIDASADDFADGWLPAPRLTIEPPAPLLLDEILLQRAKKQFEKFAGVLELDWIYLPSAIAEGPRPYFPRAVSLVDQHSGMVLAMELLPPEEDFGKIQTLLVKAFESMGGMPYRLAVQRPDLARLVQPIAARLSITLEQVDFLESTEQFHQGLLEQVAASQ